MRQTVEHMRVLHEYVVIVAIDDDPAPRVSNDSQISVDQLDVADDAIVQMTLHCGYIERPDVTVALRLLPHSSAEQPLDVDNAS
ncbi:MAG: KUP/HAK/KT family potassium transporter [Mycobacterium sp.]